MDNIVIITVVAIVALSRVIPDVLSQERYWRGRTEGRGFRGHKAAASLAKPAPTSLGGAVRDLRTEAGLSLRELADRLGWDKSRLSKYETNRLGLSLPALEAIAEGLGQPPLVVVLHCLTHRYPELDNPKSKAAKILSSLVAELSRPD